MKRIGIKCMDRQIYKSVSNGETSCVIYKTNDGDIVSDEGYVIGNINDNDIDDKIDEYEENWKEVHWTTRDWADYYGCDENEVEDCMENDDFDFEY